MLCDVKFGQFENVRWKSESARSRRPEQKFIYQTAEKSGRSVKQNGLENQIQQLERPSI